MFRIAYCDFFDPAEADTLHQICVGFVHTVRDFMPSLLRKQKVHYFLHLVESMQDYGPTSAFSAERYICTSVCVCVCGVCERWLFGCVCVVCVREDCVWLFGCELFVCVCVFCVFQCLCAGVRLRVYVHVSPCERCVCVCVCVCMCVHVCVCLHVCACVCVHVCVCAVCV